MMSIKKVKLRFNLTQHLLCKARINGVKARMLIDTGASNSCLNWARMEDYAMETDGDSFEASGASEGKIAAIQSKPCGLKLGSIKLPDFSFMILDMEHINASLKKQGAKPIDGIIGADFLLQHKVVIDYGLKCMFLND